MKQNFFISIQSLVLSQIYKAILCGFQLQTYSSIFVFDIDNTIANTWPHLVTNKSKAQPLALENLPYFKNVQQKILQYSQMENVLILYFSVRPVFTLLATHRWLGKIGLPKSATSVFLFKNPSHKVQLIKWIAAKNENIHFFDDMSFNHENGPVKLYDKEIREIEGLAIKYYGIEFLRDLQENSEVVSL